MKKNNNVVSNEGVALKSANVLSNEVVNKLAANLIADSKATDKLAKKRVDNWLKSNVFNVVGDQVNADVAMAYRNMIAAQEEYNKRVSAHINNVFDAPSIINDIIALIGKSEPFFTPEYLDKLGIYKIPNGTILDTTQKVVSFVSSLYATALSEHKKEMKDGKGVEVIWAKVKYAIEYNDSVFINTKFSKMKLSTKCGLLWNIIKDCTKSEKIEIWKRLGVRFKKVVRKDGKPTVGLIINESYVRTPNKTDINFYHEYAVNAIPLDKEDAAKVMCSPITPLVSTTKKTTK